MLKNEKTTIAAMKKGQTAKICRIETKDATIRNRLFSMGIIEGREVRITKRSLFGGTICIELLGSALALRRSEAEAISIYSL